MTTRKNVIRILISPHFTRGEKFVVKAQFRADIPMSNFEEKLWELLCACDTSHFAAMRHAFPEETAAVHAWKYGDLGERIRAAGCPI